MSTYNNEMFKMSYIFSDYSEKRIIINKKDKSAFTDEDVEKISKIKNVREVVKDDILIDSNTYLENPEIKVWDSTRINDIGNVKKVKYGHLPKEGEDDLM